MNGKEELHSKIVANQARIDELINKFILTEEISKLSDEIVRLRISCGTIFGHEYENGICKWCGSREVTK